MRLGKITVVSIITLLFCMEVVATPTVTVPPVNPWQRFCPPVGSLIKNNDTKTWASPDAGFRSFGTSFANKLSTFAGVLWQGATLGQVACRYQPNDTTLFPELLIYNQLVYQPTQAPWQVDRQKNYYCVSSDPTACPFIIRPQQKKVDVYKEALHLRDEANPYDDPGF